METILLIGEIVLFAFMAVVFVQLRQIKTYFRVTALEEGGKQLRVGLHDDVALLIKSYNADDTPDEIVMVTGNRN